MCESSPGPCQPPRPNGGLIIHSTGPFGGPGVSVQTGGQISGQVGYGLGTGPGACINVKL